MKKITLILSAAAAMLLAASCNNSIEKMLKAKGVTTSCDPEILEVRGDVVPTSVTINFPKKYFNPQAMMVVTPVIVYEGGECVGEPKIYQGESIKDNYIVVSKKNGASVNLSYDFPFVEGMRKCHLELRPVLIATGKKLTMNPIKVAEGCRTLLRDAKLNGKYTEKPDGYEKVVYQKTEGRILYDVNSDKVKKSQLKSESINNMKEELEAISNDGKSKITGTEIITYASPEGGKKLNAELSDRRAETAEVAWKGMKTPVQAETKQTQITSVGQDWEGFAEAVKKSNIADKDLILRVLSLYSDPETREKEIRNMSQLFTELKTDVFPELRRARFITSSEYDNYTDEQLKELATYRLYALDEPSLLHLATLTADKEQKATLYKLAVERYNSQNALFNLAKLDMDEKNWSGAKSYLDKISNQKDPEVLNANGVCAMNKGEFDDAEEYFIQSGSSEAAENLGVLEILKGNYSVAAQKLEAAGVYNKAAIAWIQAGEYDNAIADIKGDCACADYLRAVVAARLGDAEGVQKWTKSAVSKKPELNAKIVNDIEFAKYLNN